MVAPSESAPNSRCSPSMAHSSASRSSSPRATRRRASSCAIFLSNSASLKWPHSEPSFGATVLANRFIVFRFDMCPPKRASDHIVAPLWIPPDSRPNLKVVLHPSAKARVQDQNGKAE